MRTVTAAAISSRSAIGTASSARSESDRRTTVGSVEGVELGGGSLGVGVGSLDGVLVGSLVGVVVGATSLVTACTLEPLGVGRQTSVSAAKAPEDNARSRAEGGEGEAGDDHAEDAGGEVHGQAQVADDGDRKPPAA